MSNRLESLSNKKPTGNTGKTSLKFKPKTNVTRRSQEERAKDAPVAVKSEHERGSHSGRGSGSGRGRGAMRGGRGGGRGGMYAGTHLVSSGPLSSGSVSIGRGANGSKTGLSRDRVFNSQSPTPEFLKTLKLKELSIGDSKAASGTGSASGSADARDDFSDDEAQDLTRINMNKEYRFADEETALFPVRPVREERAEAQAATSSSSSTESSPEPELVASKSATPTPAPRERTPVKSESTEDSIDATMQQKAQETPKLETQIPEPAISIEAQEQFKFQSELKGISDLLTYQDDNQNYIVMHLPKIFPRYEEAAEEPAAAEEPLFSKFSSGPYHEKGQIGHLNIHKSGKITMNLGNDNVLEISKGMTSSFLQEVVLLDTKVEEREPDSEQEEQPKGKIFRLGASTEKLIATPSL